MEGLTKKPLNYSVANGTTIIYNLQAALGFIITMTNALSLLIGYFPARTSCYASQVQYVMQHDSNKAYKNW